MKLVLTVLLLTLSLGAVHQAPAFVFPTSPHQHPGFLPPPPPHPYQSLDV